MDKQLTAVEWIEYQVQQQGITHYFSLKEILEQAKEMEKEQLEEAELRGKEIIIIKHTEHKGGNK
jgi:hypothetical protein